MADYDIPDDLLQLKRDYLAADQRCHEIADGLPSSVSVLAMEMEPDPGGQADLVEARAERLLALEEMNRHSWWSSAGDRYAAGVALMKAAKG
jgi:hypothetical protein